MMRCDHCIHWLKVDDWQAENMGFRHCNAVRERWDIEDDVTRSIPKFPTDETVVDDEDSFYDEVGLRWKAAHMAAFAAEQAYVQDASGYAAHLITGPDFFCAKFKGGDQS